MYQRNFSAKYNPRKLLQFLESRVWLGRNGQCIILGLIMGCCGKIVHQSLNIAIGYTNLAIGKKYRFTDARIRACRDCDENTWMTALEYSAWLLSHGIEVIENYTQLEKLPKLPKHKMSKKRQKIYCQICKCYIPAKARVKDMICPMGRWKQ